MKLITSLGFESPIWHKNYGMMQWKHAGVTFERIGTDLSSGLMGTTGALDRCL